MKSMFKIFAYIWTLIKSCFSGTHRNGQSYTRLNETDIKLNFATESFSQVVKKARSDFKLIVVYLHSENHQDTDTFWDEIIQNEIFAEFINSRDFIIKMMDISTSEGYVLLI